MNMYSGPSVDTLICAVRECRSTARSLNTRW
jgi:hypothetical protein